MSNTLDRIRHLLVIAFDIAMKSGHRCKHCALVVQRGGKVVGKGYNRCLGKKNGRNSYHAEKQALMHNCLKKDLKGADLIVVRINTSLKNLHEVDVETGNLNEIFCNSKPCKMCTTMIEKCQTEYGLRNVYYTT
jgi:tRNA(Arg) A34 adenosine deaminase TadA